MTKIFIYSISLITISNFAFAQRKVLVEQFTNSGCPTCAGNTPVVASFVNSNPNDVLMLAYHTAFPYSDSMYYENSAQSNQRVTFYGVNGVPSSRVDGNFYSGNLVPTLNTTIPNAAAVPPRYKITFNSGNLYGSNVIASVLFESTDAANSGEPLKAMIVLAEKKVLKNSYLCCAGNNSETEYPWVVRRMLPDENGTTLVNTNLNGIDLVDVSWNTTNIKNYYELRIVAFVQNTSTKEIYQAELSDPSVTTGITEKNGGFNDDIFSVVNPVINNNILIHLNYIAGKYLLQISDVIGNVVFQQKINNTADNIIDSSNFTDGIYFIKMSNESNSEIKRIILTH